MTKEMLAGMIDHTCLKASASEKDIEDLCIQAKEYGFASVCVNSSRTAQAFSLLCGSGVKVCTVAGFPLGAQSTKSKVCEAVTAVQDGAEEIDMVISVGHVKDNDWNYVEQDIRSVVNACNDAGAAVQRECSVKVIIETCLLCDDEIIKVCLIAKKAGAHFVKTSTGFSTAGAKTEHVELMRNTVGKAMGVKASGGIRDLETALKMIHAGANRLGLSSGMEIISQYMSKK